MTEEAAPKEKAPENGGAKTNELLKVVDDQEEPEVFQPSSSADDVDEEEENDWKEILPPPPPPVSKEEDVNEETKPPPDTPTTAMTGGTTVPPGQANHPSQEEDGGPPDFSQYKTNVAQRLWEAQEKADKTGVKSSPDMVPLTREFQHMRKQMNLLVRYIDEYHDAMKVMKSKRAQLFEHYASMAKGTPIWTHIGKPLTAEQEAEIQSRGDENTPESIELQQKSIMQVADELGSGSLIAFQQLAEMQDKLDELDYQQHIIDYVDEWDDILTSQGEDEVKKVLELSKRRDHYVHKVDRLRNKVNRIEHRGVRDAPNGLQQKLDRNEGKLEKSDDKFEDKANDLAVMLNEGVRRGWVDLYPLIKNQMKFEVNRLGREASSYGRLTGVLSALKSDYKDATKDDNGPVAV